MGRTRQIPTLFIVVRLFLKKKERQMKNTTMVWAGTGEKNGITTIAFSSSLISRVKRRFFGMLGGRVGRVTVFAWVCLQSIFSPSMPGASNAHLILSKPCHETSFPSSLCFSIVTISIAKKYCPCWPFPYSLLFYFWLLTEWLIWRPFCGLGRGKKDGGGVCTTMGAGMRKWPSEIHSNTHRHTVIQVGRDLWDCESNSQCFFFFFLIMGVWELNMGRWPRPTSSQKLNSGHDFFECVGGGISE